MTGIRLAIHQVHQASPKNVTCLFESRHDRSQLLDRLTARLGKERIKTPCRLQDPRPEYANRLTKKTHIHFLTFHLALCGYSIHLSRLGRHQKKQDIPYFKVQNALSLAGGILNLLVDAIGFAYSNTRESVGSFRISTQKVGGLQAGSLKSDHNLLNYWSGF